MRYYRGKLDARSGGQADPCGLPSERRQLRKGPVGITDTVARAGQELAGPALRVGRQRAGATDAAPRSRAGNLDCRPTGVQCHVATG